MILKLALSKTTFVVGLYSLQHDEYKYIEFGNNTGNGYTYLLSLLKIISKEDGYIVTFGGKHYDMPIIEYLTKNDFSNVPNREIVYLLNRFGDYISNNSSWYRDEDYARYKYNNYKHIDLMYYHPNGNMYNDIYAKNIKRESTNDMHIIKQNLEKDLNMIHAIYKDSLPEIEERRMISDQYGVNIFSVTRPQVLQLTLSSVLSDHDKRNTDDVEVVNPSIALDYVFTNHEMNTFKDCILSSGPITKKSVNYNFEIDDVTYSITSGILKSKSLAKGYIEDVHIVDAKSMYASVLLHHKIIPPHLDADKVITLYEHFSNYKDVSACPKLYKSMLVSLVGYYNSNACEWLTSVQSWIKVVVRTTLHMLEKVNMLIDRGCKIIFVNVDGICYKGDAGDVFDNDYISWNDKHYDFIFLKDANNYLAYGDETDTRGLFAINNRYPIIAKAIHEYLVNGNSYIDYIRDKSNNPFDYCMIYQVTDNNKQVVYNGINIQGTNRVYVSDKGHYLYVVENNKMKKLSNEKVILYNSMIAETHINYDFYINEVKKILITQQTLF